jgi:hypothetical protein
MTEEIDISKCICIYTYENTLKKSILVSVYIY